MLKNQKISKVFSNIFKFCAIHFVNAKKYQIQQYIATNKCNTAIKLNYFVKKYDKIYLLKLGGRIMESKTYSPPELTIELREPTMFLASSSDRWTGYY